MISSLQLPKKQEANSIRGIVKTRARTKKYCEPKARAKKVREIQQTYLLQILPPKIGRPNEKRFRAESEAKISIHCGDALRFYDSWPSPVTIVSDGPYGIGGFEGDPPTPETLPDWYEPHVEAWTKLATPQTTLWFWNTEIGWASVHPLLAKFGWVYRNCHVWNKGKAHVAGNANTKSLRKFPVITEVCVQYIKEARFQVRSHGEMNMKDWLRHEWERSGLPLYMANEACGVRNAATRKYFTKDHLWYYPPPELFERLVRYVNEHGRKEGRPYFSINGKAPVSSNEWRLMRAKFYCEFGVHNVWNEPPVHGNERVKDANGYAHANQKPLKLVEITLRATTDEGDVVWEPFGGLCTVALAAKRLNRSCYSAEINPNYYRLALERIANDAPI